MRWLTSLFLSITFSFVLANAFFNLHWRSVPEGILLVGVIALGFGILTTMEFSISMRPRTT